MFRSNRKPLTLQIQPQSEGAVMKWYVVSVAAALAVVLNLTGQGECRTLSPAEMSDIFGGSWTPFLNHCETVQDSCLLSDSPVYVASCESQNWMSCYGKYVQQDTTPNRKCLSVPDSGWICSTEADTNHHVWCRRVWQCRVGMANNCIKPTEVHWEFKASNPPAEGNLCPE